MILNPGDRVRLTARCAKAFSQDRQHRVNWVTRVGTVMETGRYGARVCWDGCRSRDPWPLQALQKDYLDGRTDI